ncbi:DinB family protein [Fictibacillus aquaticus]|uniref:DinB family protein n=1 Tax=Fictibacillus aquaticus TaxID=2021314 RepID=UPI0013FD62CC|nr:DinB family protein [Fictibacillus aquaticus]
MEKTIQHLFAYHVWGTEKMLRHLEDKAEGFYNLEITSVFPSIKAVVDHVLEVDDLWFSRMIGRTAGVILTESPKEAREKFSVLHEEITAYLNSVDPLENITYKTSQGETFQNSVEELITHLVNHGTYHRGNLSAMLRQQGIPGGSTDYIYFLRENSLKSKQ